MPTTEFWKRCLKDSISRALGVYGMNRGTIFLLIGSVFLGVILVMTSDGVVPAESEWLVNLRMVLVPTAVFIFGPFVFYFVTFPARNESAILSNHANERDEDAERIKSLEQQINTKQKLVDGSHKLLALMEEAQEIREEKRRPIYERRLDWHKRVREVLREYYPEAEAGFAAVQTRFKPEMHRDILIEEMKKIDGGILVSIRHPI